MRRAAADEALLAALFVALLAALFVALFVALLAIQALQLRPVGQAVEPLVQLATSPGAEALVLAVFLGRSAADACLPHACLLPPLQAPCASRASLWRSPSASRRLTTCRRWAGPC